MTKRKENSILMMRRKLSTMMRMSRTRMTTMMKMMSLLPRGPRSEISMLYKMRGKNYLYSLHN
jgi:hypothetical protein